MELKMSNGVMDIKHFNKDAGIMRPSDLVYRFGRMRIDNSNKISVKKLYNCLLITCVNLYGLQGRVDAKRLSEYLKKPDENELRERVREILVIPDPRSEDYFVEMFMNLTTVFVSRLEDTSQKLQELKKRIGDAKTNNTISHNINVFENDNKKISNETIKKDLEELKKLIEKEIEPCLSIFSKKLYDQRKSELKTIKGNIDKIIKKLGKSEKQEIIESKEWKDVKKLVNSEPDYFYMGDLMGEFEMLGDYIKDFDIK